MLLIGTLARAREDLDGPAGPELVTLVAPIVALDQLPYSEELETLLAARGWLQDVQSILETWAEAQQGEC
jgi:hypothetical protein